MELEIKSNIIIKLGSDLFNDWTLDNANSKFSSLINKVSFNLIKLACYFLDGIYAIISLGLVDNVFS